MTSGTYNQEMRPAATVLALLGLLLVFVWRRGLGPDPVPSTQGETRFSAHRALEVLNGTIGGRIPHPLGSTEHRAVRDRIVAHLQGLGYDTQIQRRFACSPTPTCAWVENIVARGPHARGGQAIIAAAHYDSVPAAPGASDDGAGVASLLEVARILRHERTRRPIVFLIDDGEEAGLLGAEAFVQEQRDVAAMVNVEARGSSGQSYLFETSDRNATIGPLVARALPRPVTTSLFATIYDRIPNDTDLTVFKRAGLQGVNFAFVGDVARYHTPADRTENLDLRSLQHQGDNALAAIRTLANAGDLTPAAENAVWFDLLGFAVVAWPASWSIWLAAACLLIVLAGAVRLRNPSRIIFGLAGFIGSILMSGVVAAGMSWLSWWRHGDATWIAYPEPVIGATWLIGLTVPFAIGAFLRTRGSFDELFAGHALGWALLATLLGWQLPGASYLAILPAAMMAVGSLPRRMETTRAAIAAFVAGILFFPIVLVLYGALGRPALVAIAILIAVASTTFSALADRVSYRALLMMAPLVLALILITNMLPSYTSRNPRRLNVLYLDDGAGTYWTTSVVPTPLERFHFDKKVMATPWVATPRPQFAADAPDFALPPPELTIISDSVAGGRRTVQMAIASRRAARGVVLAIRCDVPVRALRIDGAAPPPRSRRSRRFGAGWTRVALREAKAVVDITFEGSAPLDLVWADYTYGLPLQGRAVARARDDSAATQSDDGDLTTTMRRMRLP